MSDTEGKDMSYGNGVGLGDVATLGLLGGAGGIGYGGAGRGGFGGGYGGGYGVGNQVLAAGRRQRFRPG